MIYDIFLKKYFLSYPEYLEKNKEIDLNLGIESLFSYMEKEVPMNFCSYEHLKIPKYLLDIYESHMKENPKKSNLT
jgi:hypothetical protein